MPSRLVLCIAIACSSLTSCATSTPSSPDLRPATPPANLLTPCGPLPQLDSAELKTTIAVLMAAAKQYHVCASRHRRLAQWAEDPEGLTPGP